MRGLKQTIASLASHRDTWKKMLAAASAKSPLASSSHADKFEEVTAFGSNPGQLRMLTYVPRGLRSSAPLVVVLHGCTQTAAAYDHGTGWSDLADRCGFALLMPEQQRSNNPNLCFNWFLPDDTRRDGGEPLSIRQMIDAMISSHGLDRRRIYVTGLSAGGAMAAVMLATYPELFAGGSIVAGLPYGCATNMEEAFGAMFQARSLSAAAWGNKVRAAAPAYREPRAKVSIWHGGADATVVPLNAVESIKQWTDVHGLDAGRPTVDKINGFPHAVWHNAQGEAVVEAYTITGMAHGVPIDPGVGGKTCGNCAPFILDMGISSTHLISEFWGLADFGPHDLHGTAAPDTYTRPAEAAAESALHARAFTPANDTNSIIRAALRKAGLLRP